MKVSENWLREWVDPKESLDALVHLLTMAGLEVDGVEAATKAFTCVVVGEIVAVEQHPDAEKLRVCRVNDGSSEHQVVCGAPNAAVGMRVPFATVGAELPGGMKIKKAKLRGVESFGMLCGASELGLEDKIDGLMELGDGIEPGTEFRQALGLDDQVVDIDLTPNRGDCLSIMGVAREVGVLTQTDVAGPELVAVAAVTDKKPVIRLAAPEHCPRYAGRIIENVDVTASTPLWMQEKLRRAGLRSIDAVVDVTNYVLLELGQPLHAFDNDKVQGDITVRLANQDEKLKLLDDSEVELAPDMLVIADDREAIALAGIMGGASTAVSGSTRNVLLESAYFVPVHQAGKARSLGMHTDASHRFERGVDRRGQERAIERATELLLEIAGGQPGETVVAEVADTAAVNSFELRSSQIERLLGFAIPAERVEDIFTRLELAPERSDEGWCVTVPAHRFDLAIEADLLEELARIYGYDQLPVEAPVADLVFQSMPETRLGVDAFRRLLVARGYREAITYSFVDLEQQALFSPDIAPVKLANPISSDMAVMRTSLLPGLVTAAEYNLNRQQDRVRLFESGLRFLPAKGEGSLVETLQQEVMLAGLLCGNRQPESWASDNRQVVDFYDLKSDVEALLDLAGASGQVEYRATNCSALHPGQAAEIVLNGQIAGNFGLLHPGVAQKLGMGVDIWLFELHFGLISDKKVPEFKELSKFPEVRRDLAIIVDSSLNASEVMACARQAAGDGLVEVILFDQYSGEGIAEGKQSIGLGMTWQHAERTLNDEEVGALMEGVVAALQKQFNASLR